MKELKEKLLKMRNIEEVYILDEDTIQIEPDCTENYMNVWDIFDNTNIYEMENGNSYIRVGKARLILNGFDHYNTTIYSANFKIEWV